MNKNNAAINSVEQIIAYLDSELKYYEKIAVLVKQQREAIQSGDTKKLGLLMSENESHIKEIKRLMNTKGKVIETLSYQRELRSDNTIKTLLKKKQSLLIYLLHYDKNSINFLESSVNDLKTKAGSIQKRSRILSTLKSHRIDTPRYLDIVH
ncbi:MAG: hypothetical protein GY941_00335 [Planctomycetes bacterium]|nr:hypothetical protein [Planctomycetota bacterium]